MLGKRIAVVAAAALIGALLALAGSHTGLTIGGWPIFALGVALALVVQWIAWIPAAVLRTERGYDLVGSATFVAVAVLGLVAAAAQAGWQPRPVVLALLVVVWAARLGTFLALRVRRAPDRRFDEIKADPSRFLVAWTMQGLWIAITSGAALAAITSGRAGGVDAFLVVGGLLWLAGFAIEAVADAQKRAFRADPANAGQFIRSGLWAWSRHPNYFGEILLWVGVAIAALPALEGWQWATLVSPVFVVLLLVRVSGLPQLERSAEERWGDRADYRAYRDSTPVLVPRPPRRAG